MGTPCGKCGSGATYTNEHWGNAGRIVETGCLMCGWRDLGTGPLGRILVTKAVRTRQSALTRRGYCANCMREDVVLINASLCSTCYKWRKDEATLAACAERLRREYESGTVHRRRGRVLPGRHAVRLVPDGDGR